MSQRLLNHRFIFLSDNQLKVFVTQKTMFWWPTMLNVWINQNNQLIKASCANIHRLIILSVTNTPSTQKWAWMLNTCINQRMDRNVSQQASCILWYDFTMKYYIDYQRSSFLYWKTHAGISSFPRDVRPFKIVLQLTDFCFFAISQKVTVRFTSYFNSMCSLILSRIVLICTWTAWIVVEIFTFSLISEELSLNYLIHI